MSRPDTLRTALFTVRVCSMDRRNVSEELQTSDTSPASKKQQYSEVCSQDYDSSLSHNRNASKVTFESFVTQTSASSSPKTRDQCVMAQIEPRESRSNTLVQHEPKTSCMPVSNEGAPTGTTNSSSTKSSVRELLQSQKSTNRRKSKSQNRARKALRTITFILGTVRRAAVQKDILPDLAEQ